MLPLLAQHPGIRRGDMDNCIDKITEKLGVSRLAVARVISENKPKDIYLEEAAQITEFWSKKYNKRIYILFIPCVSTTKSKCSEMAFPVIDFLSDLRYFRGNNICMLAEVPTIFSSPSSMLQSYEHIIHTIGFQASFQFNDFMTRLIQTYVNFITHPDLEWRPIILKKLLDIATGSLKNGYYYDNARVEETIKKIKYPEVVAWIRSNRRKPADIKTAMETLTRGIKKVYDTMIRRETKNYDSAKLELAELFPKVIRIIGGLKMIKTLAYMFSDDACKDVFLVAGTLEFSSVFLKCLRDLGFDTINNIFCNETGCMNITPLYPIWEQTAPNSTKYTDASGKLVPNLVSTNIWPFQQKN